MQGVVVSQCGGSLHHASLLTAVWVFNHGHGVVAIYQGPTTP